MILRFFGQLSANVVQTFSISDQANSSPYCQGEKEKKKKMQTINSLGQVFKHTLSYLKKIGVSP